MKRKLFEIWKVNYGTKILWKVQFPKGIMTFSSKQKAMKVVEAFNK